MTPEYWTMITIAVLTVAGSTLGAWWMSRRSESQANNDDANSLKTMSETQERLVTQNARIMAQNEEILARLNGYVDVNGRFDMKVLMEDGEAPLTGVVRTFRPPVVDNPT